MRRMFALVAMVVLIVLALGLLWRVYLHHQSTMQVDPEREIVFQIMVEKIATRPS